MLLEEGMGEWKNHQDGDSRQAGAKSQQIWVVIYDSILKRIKEGKKIVKPGAVNQKLSWLIKQGLRVKPKQQ